MPELITPSVADMPRPPAPSRVAEPPRRNNTFLLVLILLCSLVGAVLGGYSLWLELASQPVEEVEEEPIVLEEEVLPVEGVDYLEFNGQQISIQQDLAVNSYDVEAFSQEEGIILYEGAQLGVDVSQYQGEVDWQAVADFGVEFAILRLGYRGYGEEGTVNLDETFHQNMEGAKAAGLEVGVYFFSQATSVWEAKEEAYFVLEHLEGYSLDLPVVFDWEFITHTSSSRTAGQSGRSITLYAQVFCDEIEREGYQPAVYFNQDLGYLYLDLSELSDYPFWLASYRDVPTFHYHFDIWQYSHTGTVDGIEGAVDLNLKFY